MYHEKNKKIMLIFMLGNTLEVGEFQRKSALWWAL
jgi:hypothetical protein